MIRVVHKDCGKVAFYFRKKLKRGDLIETSNIVNLDGTIPLPHTAMICGSCGGWINLGGSMEQQHWTDWFVIKD